MEEAQPRRGFGGQLGRSRRWPAEKAMQTMTAAGSLSASIDRDLQARDRPCLDLIDALRKDGVEKKIDIPQITVHGRSELWQIQRVRGNIGHPIPRGVGFVTRCATQITMFHGLAWCAEVKSRGQISLKSNELNSLGLTHSLKLARQRWCVCCAMHGNCGSWVIAARKSQRSSTRESSPQKVSGCMQFKRHGQDLMARRMDFRWR